MERGIKEAIRLYKSNRFELALRELLAIEESPAENLELSYYLGLCYTKLGQYDEALLYLEQVVTSHSNLFRIYQSRMVLSYIYTVTDRYKLAQFELNKLVDAGFESPQVYSAYGYILYAQNQVEKSIEYLKKALSLDPDNANAQNSLGYILAEEEINLEEALGYCKTAVRLKPENPAYLDSLGWTYYRLGKVDEAAGYLKKANSLAGGNKTIASHLREVLREQAKE